jgi:ParB family chromosome partitioning protein
MQRKALGQGMLGVNNATKPIGLGLSALVPAALPVSKDTVKIGPAEIEIAQIIPNRHQPREHFDNAALEGLAKSIREHGVIQPILVRALPASDASSGSHARFELIAGERRMRAAMISGLTKIPAIIKEADHPLSMEYALLENIQREELNPIEQAKAYGRLLSEFALTQEQISERIGVNRSTIANTLRLLHLPETLWGDIAKGAISMGHAKVLLSLPTKDLQLQVAGQIKEKGLSVRQLEAIVKSAAKTPPTRQKPVIGNLSHDLKNLENRIQQAIGTKVRIAPSGKDTAKGEIKIEYYSLDDLDRILEKLSV